jgi:type I restriction-modification system DNA methylase subunit
MTVWTEYCILDVNFRTAVSELNQSLSQLDEKKSLEAGIGVASKVLELLGINDVGSADDVVDGGLLKLPNSERQDPWFHPHPWMRGERAAFELIDSDLLPVEAKFYWLQKRGNAYVAGGVHFTKNWEDHDFTRTDEFKIGIDFFLTQDAESVLVVLSDRGKLRVMELSSMVSNTQLEIFERWFQAKSPQNRDSLHALLWESFKLQAVNAKFYDGVANAFAELLMHLKSHGKDEEEAKLFASRLLGRLIFVWFLRKMGSISATAGYFDPTANSQIDYYRNDVERLFFRTLNTPIGDRRVEGNETLDIETPYLNGGLFAPHPGDWLEDPTLSFPDFFFERLFDHFENFNFTTDESTPEYEQVAIDPEMLGRVFESLLASQVSATGEQARKAKGAFYTPREVVAYMCRESVRNHLLSAEPDDERLRKAVFKLLDTSDQDWAIAGSNSLRDIPQDLRQGISSGLGELRAIDPACGSGAFPLGLLQLLTKVHLRLDPRLDGYKLKLSILQKNIFGIDIEPMAIEISRLRAWLSLIVEEQKNKDLQPLPNLDFNFVCANSLVGLDGTDLFTDEKLQEKLQALRETYFLALTPDKKKAIQKEYTKLLQPDLLDDIDTRASQLKTFNPFDADHVAAFFDSEHMFGVENGFDMVLGNPPYIGEKGNKETFRAVKNSSLGKRFAQGKMDYFYYFFHLALDLVAEGGIVCFITTNYYPKAPSAKLLRQEFRKKTNVLKLINFQELKIFKSAVGQHNLITILTKTEPNPDHIVQTCVTERRGDADSSTLKRILDWSDEETKYFAIKQSELYKGERLDIAVKAGTDLDLVLDSLEARGINLNTVSAITNGLHTGADKVFVFDDIPMEIANDTEVVSGFIKPLHKSSDIFRFGLKETSKKVLYIPNGLRLAEYPSLEKYLTPFKNRLASRAQIVRSGQPWHQLLWPRDPELFAFSPKVVAPYSSRTNRFFYTEDEFYGSGDTYVISGRGQVNLKAICAYLNSTVGLVWFRNRGKLKGNMIFLQADSLGVFPLPKVTHQEMQELEGLLSDIQDLVAKEEELGATTTTVPYLELYRALDDLTFKHYKLSESEIATLKAEAAILLEE